MSVLNTLSIKRIHCIGIGGIGVSGLAELLLKKGYAVSGSDVSESAIITRLIHLGIYFEKGHKAKCIKDADLVVYSSAIAQDNPELLVAKAENIPLISRGQLLAELMQSYFSIAVAGTHGKTTSTGFIANTLVAANFDPSYVIGGRIRDQETTVRFGNSRYFVAEADESDTSFLFMTPNIAVVTNIEADHLENYSGDFNQLKKAFLTFIESLPKDGVAILGIDCPVIRALLPNITRRVVTFGFCEEADFRVRTSTIQGLQSQLTIHRQNATALMLTLNLPGKHNILNALTAVIVADELGISDEVLTKSLVQFPGMGRRFHSHGALPIANGEVFLFEDYGHHPSAIAATLSTAKQAWPNQRIVLVFQPHRYSRTRDLMMDFVRVLGDADLLVLMDVFAASEPQDKAGSAQTLLQALEAARTTSVFIPGCDEVIERLPSLLQPNDIVIFQGAGNVGSLASKLKEV